MWNPSEHTDQENLRWSWLRAVEWGSWPIFISQPLAPIAFLYFPWWSVILAILALNLVWSLFVRYRIVIPSLAYWGVIFVKLKWISGPISAFFLWSNGLHGIALLSLFWPIVLFLVPHLPTQIGIIQKMFMKCLGYDPSQENN